MTPQQEPEREEKREGVAGEVCETGLEIVGGIVDIGGAIAEGAGGVLSGTLEVVAGAAEVMGGVAGEAASGCAGCLPVVLIAVLLPVGLLGAHFVY